MATAVASRFAILGDDVEDDFVNRKKRPQVKKPETSKPTGTVSNPKTNKKKKNKENAQTQVTKSKPTKESTGGAKKTKEATPEQWEEWKEKDATYVDVNYKADLSEALLLSKLDFEEKKDFYQQVQTVEQKPPDPIDKRPGGKKNKKTIKVLSVEEFHNLGKVKSREESPSTLVETELVKDTEFFIRLQEDVKKEFIKDKTSPKKKTVEVRKFDDEILTLAKVRDALDKKIQEVTELTSENNILKEELMNVKKRNKKLCQILANGEMKEKAEVLMEVDKLQNMRDELSEQVASLHAQLEQERSKVRALSNDQKSKDRNKKRTTSSSDQ